MWAMTIRRLARKPWSSCTNTSLGVFALYFGFFLVVGELVQYFEANILAEFAVIDGLGFKKKDFITTGLLNRESTLIETDWEPWKLQHHVRCDSRAQPSAKDITNSSDWFPYIEEIKKNDFVIISNTNCGYLDFAFNFWEHYQQIGYSNVVFIAEDCIAYNALTSRLGKHHVAPPIMERRETSEDEIFSEIFRNMTLLRPRYLHYFLNRGVSVLWQDIDSVPIQDTMNFFPKGYDVVAVDDRSTDAHYSSNYLCACLLFLNPSQHTFTLLNQWMSEIEMNINNDRDNDQLALNRALSKLKHKKQITLAVLPRTVFPNGHDYDSYATTSAWIHANYLIGGESKRNFLRKRGYWTSLDSFNCT